MNGLMWNVYAYNAQARCVITYNILAHDEFLNAIRSCATQYPNNKKMFADDVRLALAYYFWGKQDWEITMIARDTGVKCYGNILDVYDQVMANWDVFIDYVWSHKNEIGTSE